MKTSSVKKTRSMIKRYFGNWNKCYSLVRNSKELVDEKR